MNIAVSSGGDIAQVFKFGNSKISIANSAGGQVAQDWKVGGSSYQLAKMDGMGSVQNGSLDKKTMNKYKNLISSWCKANDFFVGKDNCVVY